jgi:hypothetical protein
MPRLPDTARRPSATRRLALAAAAAVVATVPAASGPEAADLPPPLMARFTKTVQPLLLNKCAAGACHGGPAAHPPRFHRANGAGIDRQITLANIEAITTLAAPNNDPAAMLATISGRHPVGGSATMPTAVPLTTQERATLEAWLTAALANNAARAIPRPAFQPNRFRAMLDAAANPPPLPPPQEPQGLILGADGEPRRNR